MKALLSALVVLSSTPAFAARESCENLAETAATALATVNNERRRDVAVEVMSDSATKQVVEVEFSYDGSAYIAYEVTVERGGGRENQNCFRVSKIEITREE